MNKLQFFKQTLEQLINIKNRNEHLDDCIKKILKDDVFCKDFPIYLSGVGQTYEFMLIKTLAQLWNKPKEVEEEISYLIYEIKFGEDNIITDTTNNKKYNIKDVDSFIKYLLDYYTILGE